jgi:hypothetical protein
MKVLSNMIKAILLSLAALILLSSAAFAEDEAQTPAPGPSAGNSYDLISTGERLSLKGGDFTIVPPNGWEVFTNHPSLTLLMQVPHEASLKYQRTIQVASFGGKKYIDEVTAREFEQIIVSKFSQLSESIEGYAMREHRVVDMADGREGILFYTDFTIDGVSMMQAHILLSSEVRHYLLTFTDLRDHFEKEEYSQFLNEAWTSMISTELAGDMGSSVLSTLGLASYKRFQTLILIGLATVGMTIFLFLFSLARKKFAGNSFGSYREEDDQTSHGTVPESRIQSSMPASEMPRSGANTMHETMSHSAPAKTAGKPVSSLQSSTKAPMTTQTAHETHYEVAEAADESDMEDFFADDDEDKDKAI